MHRLRRQFSSSTSKRLWTFKDITYLDESQDTKHKLDIYIQSEPFPRKPQRVVIFVHGGSWQRGDRRMSWMPNTLYGNVGRACAERGLTCAVISYRLAPSFQHPDQVSDVARAITWVNKNIGTYGGKSSDIVLIAHSAGAHLAALCLAEPKFLEEAGLSSPPLSCLRGFVGLSGIYDLVRLGSHPVGRLLVETAFGKDSTKWTAASPLAILKDKSNPPPPLASIPMLLITAEKDFHLSQDADALIKAAEERSDTPVQRSHTRLEGAYHSSTVVGFGQVFDPTSKLTFDFIQSLGD